MCYQKNRNDELFARTKIEESGILIGVWDFIG